MKKMIFMLILLVSSSVFADAKDLLKQRIDKVQGFYATFSQQVKTAENQIIQQGKGELWINRPSYFNWTMSEPDKTVILSDSKDIWIYMPEVEQVTVMSLNQAIDNQLLFLITDSHNAVWNNYNVSQTQNTFTLKPVTNDGRYFIISVLPTGMMTNFTIVETDGQLSYYELSNQTLGSVNKRHFKFTLPKGVTVDDQR